MDINFPPLWCGRRIFADFIIRNSFTKNLRLGDGTGRLINVRKFTSSGTYTPSPGTKFIIAELLGGGGGGGSNAVTTTTGYAAAASGGFAGDYGVAKLPAESYSVVVGAGGSGGVAATAGSNGTTGGSTSIGTLSLPGGNGGSAGTAINVFPRANLIPGYSNTPEDGFITTKTGDYGSRPLLLGSAAVISGDGGSSPWGAGAPGRYVESSTGSAPGFDGFGYGSGGSGSGSVSGTNGTSQPGGAGSPGLVIVWEYA